MIEYDALEDFAGPGGWDEGARLLGLRFYGVDYDKAACETARAAGHEREQADVTEHESPAWARGKGHVSSPSCTLFSMAGSGIGRLVIDVLARATKSILTGEDPATVREMARGAIYPVALAEAEAKNAKRKPEKKWSQEKVEAKAHLDAKIAALVLEPARRIVELGPEWLAFEQVPEVLPIWHAYQTVLSNQGWSVWTGVLNAADYGVPQTRRRAILIASRVRNVAPPEPTHAESPQGADLFGNSLEKWVCMADALGWGWEDEPSCTVSSGGAATGGAEPFANADYRRRLREYVVDRRQMSKGPGGSRVPVAEVPVTRPAPTPTSKAGGQWVLRASNQANSAIRPDHKPAPTMLFAHACNDVRFYPKGTEKPGEPMRAGDRPAESSKLEIWEAGILQSFPADYPWQGTRSKQYEQVGNAIPPLLAMHVLAAVTGVAIEVAA